MTNMTLWYQLGTPSRRAIGRAKTRYGKPYDYRPRGNLLERLARDNNLSKEEVYRQLMAIRQHLLTSNVRG